MYAYYYDALGVTEPGLGILETRQEVKDVVEKDLRWVPAKHRARIVDEFMGELDKYGDAELRHDEIVEELLDAGDVAEDDLDGWMSDHQFRIRKKTPRRSR